jgi:hypothetical protein
MPYVNNGAVLSQVHGPVAILRELRLLPNVPVNLKHEHGVAALGMPDTIVSIYLLAAALLKAPACSRGHRLLFSGECWVILPPEAIPQVCWSTP